MEETMKKKGVIDRIEGQHAIILIDEKPMNILLKLLPEKSKEGDWLELEIDNGEVINARMDLEESSRARERITEKMAKLRKGNHLK
jgi:hypothetical protein